MQKTANPFCIDGVITRESKARATAAARAALLGFELHSVEFEGEQAFLLRRAGISTVQCSSLQAVDEQLRRLEARPRGRAGLALVQPATVLLPGSAAE
jgi:hypothetical protein